MQTRQSLVVVGIILEVTCLAFVLGNLSRVNLTSNVIGMSIAETDGSVLQYWLPGTLCQSVTLSV